MKTYLLICSIVLSSTFTLLAQEAEQPTRQTKLEQFITDNGNDWDVRWKGATSVPRTVSNGLSKVYEGTPESIGRQFLSENAAVFSMKTTLNDLELTSTKTHRGVTHVTFNQTLNGIPVEGGQYKVHIREDGRVDMANGFYYPNITVSTKPAITPVFAIASATADLGLSDSKNEDKTPELVLLPVNDTTLVLSYKTHIYVEEPYTNWLYFIDANTGEIVQKYNQITTVTGTGKVYPKHPNNSTLSTKSLYGLDGNGKLDGTYVRAKNSSSSDAYSTSHSFNYTATNTHFDEVNLYYHVDNFRRNFIEGLDAGNNLFNFIEAYAHNESICPNNACYNPSTQDIYFSSANYEFAKEDKIIHHEYSHKVVRDIEGGITSGVNGEEGSISEGTPDYFAGSFTGRPRILEYAVSFAERDMSSPFYSHYNQLPTNGNGDITVASHIGGEFFSSILWDIRNHSGITAAQTDFLVFDALFRITGSPDFLEFRDAMIAADNASYGGAHYAIIRNAFAAKGIGTPITPPSLKANIIGPNELYPGQFGMWFGSASNGTPPYSYEWQKRNEGSSYWYIMGYTSTYSTSSSVDFDLKLIVTDSQNNTAYKQISVDHDGGPIPKVIGQEPQAIPEMFGIAQNYPNPFNPSTNIRFELPEASTVTISVFNLMGQEVATLVDQKMEAGSYTQNFEASNLSSGFYFARIVAVGASGEIFTKSIKMQLIK